MNAGYLLIHPEWGIYLGEFIGLGFWSKLDSVGQTYAVVFLSQREALEFASKTFPTTESTRMETTPILTKRRQYALLEEIVEAGLEGWDPG